jgi:hypothetical protein
MAFVGAYSYSTELTDDLHYSKRCGEDSVNIGSLPNGTAAADLQACTWRDICNFDQPRS